MAQGRPHHIDTIVALSSGRPPAAIAVVRTSGPDAHAAATAIAGRLPPARKAVVRRLVDPRDGTEIDQALLLRFDAPRSVTGEDIVEYQCHGGRATVDALVTALLARPGMRQAEPGEFTRRALANGRIDLTEAEGLADLLEAETELQRRSAMARAGGRLRSLLDGWRQRLLGLAARAELAIDYVDEEEGHHVPDLSAEFAALAGEMAELLSAPRIEPLRDGIRVVAAGPPNAGKSSLINALSRSEKAIVTHVAGTTRDVIEVPVAIAGIPFVLVDTAGLRESADLVESLGIDRARGEAEQADLLLWLGEASDAPRHPGLIQVHAKSDIAPPGPGIAVSALTGEGVARLTALIVAEAGRLIPKGDQLALDRRQHELLGVASAALERAAGNSDPLLAAEELRHARHAIDRISGQAGVEELLDALFSRFCLGK